MKPLLLASLGRALPALDALLSRDEVEVVRAVTLPEPQSLDAERPTVVLLDRALVLAAPGGDGALARLAERAEIIGIGEAGESEPGAEQPVALLSGFIADGTSASAAQVTLRGALRHAASLVATRRAARLEERSSADLALLTRIGVALSNERDLMTLLSMILTNARRLSTADAGSLYLVERRDTGPPMLLFKLSQNSTLPDLPFSEYEIPLDGASLAGYAALTGEPLVIPDVYFLPKDASYRQNRSFDEKFDYRTMSVCVIPMRTHRDEVIGVVQLINRKRSADVKLSSPEVVLREVLPFDQRSVDLVSALSSLAAVAIENGRLYEDIERLFEGFVTASVTAIESRDPTTSGHSSRVATLTCGLAESVDRGGGTGAYKDLKFSRVQMRELRYAVLLHDFG